MENRAVVKPEPDFLIEVIYDFKYGNASGLQAFMI
jgi:hypothetical protein